jgi:hypothetical protein
MDWPTFAQLPDATISTQLQGRPDSCWALAIGGTRRAYVAQGGRLSQPDHLAAYFQWLEAAHRAVIDQLFDWGIQTVIATEHVPVDRGPEYRELARLALQAVVAGPGRQAWYARRQIRLSISGDLAPLADQLALPQALDAWPRLAEATAGATGPRLVYLFRGDWVDVATEEAHAGYQLGLRLGRPPTRDELVAAYYGCTIPALSVYLGSGRPHLRHLRPPFLTGSEDCYWSHAPILQLSPAGWRRILYDHLWSRRTRGNRTYADGEATQVMMGAALTPHVDRVLGVGAQHAAGFWMPTLE